MISWQAFAAWAPRITTDMFTPAAHVLAFRLRDITIGFFVLVIGLGALLYPSYRFVVRPYLEIQDMRAANGAFEIKEHFAALALLMLPAYRAVWQNSTVNGTTSARRAITGILCAMVWWNFVVGHGMNYIRGLSL
jgi:hypothetical protein